MRRNSEHRALLYGQLVLYQAPHTIRLVWTRLTLHVMPPTHLAINAPSPNEKPRRMASFTKSSGDDHGLCPRVSVMERGERVYPPTLKAFATWCQRPTRVPLAPLTPSRSRRARAVRTWKASRGVLACKRWRLVVMRCRRPCGRARSLRPRPLGRAALLYSVVWRIAC